MPIDSKHFEYDAMFGTWRDCRDAIEGERAVKKSGQLHLPKLGGQGDDEYLAYLKRAMFYGASGRTLQGLTGLMFRKDPIFEAPNVVKKWSERATQRGTDIHELARSVCENLLATGRHGVLLDMPREELVEVNPFAVGYMTEAIINWRVLKDGSEEIVTLLVLEEQYEEVDNKDQYKAVAKQQWRVLKLVPREFLLEDFEGGIIDDEMSMELFGTRFIEIPDLVYVVELWRRKEDKARTVDNEEFLMVDSAVPRVRGRVLDRIPFFFFNTKDSSPNTLPNPPMDPIVTVNLSHYRNSADLEHGQHFTALPTPWAAGFKLEKGSQLKIGSSVAWISEEPTAKAGYLEFSGSGLGRLAESMSEKEKLMAVLGARMLEEPKRSVEAADTHRVRKSGESASLADLAGVISAGIEKVLQLVAEWLGNGGKEIQYEINKDYDLAKMDPQTLNALFMLLQGRRMSYETFFWNIKRGEMIPEGVTLEEELERLENEAPPPSTFEKDNLEDDDEDEEDDSEDDEDEREEEEEDT